jgi:hypothetical protein
MSREQDQLDPELELAATAVELSQLGELESLPVNLRAKLDADAAHLLAVPNARTTAPAAPLAISKSKASPLLQLGGWLAAAACLVIAAMSWMRAPREVTKVVTVTAPPQVAPAPKSPTVAEKREQLRRSGKDIVEVGWTTTKDPASRGTTGNVVWSTSDQLGYMHFHGLAANDRSQSTYQLWIFDQERDAKYPVDGGTFDIDSNSDVIVPITAKIRVNKPTLFAVTVEKPGGVVVSKRERIVVTAAVN